MSAAREFQDELERHLSTWGPNCGAPIGVYRGHLRKLLVAAIRAEREACAKIALEYQVTQTAKAILERRSILEKKE